METRPINEWKREVGIVLESKRNEFEILGYKEINTEEIWRCLVENVMKHKKDIRLYEVVQAIFQLQIHTYMDFLAIDSLHQSSEDELLASIHAVMQQEEKINK